MAPTEIEKEQQWTGRHLLISALIQLMLVHIAYRIDRSKSVPYLSTASWAIVFGIAFGALLSFMSKKRANGMGLDPQILFFALLPPIILEAGFNTQRKGFFSNFWSILLLAIVGTVVATLATAGGLIWLGRNVDFITELKPAEALLYGSLISAIDPVSTLVVLKKSHAPSLLFNLLFGESVLNDAVSIVISVLFQQSVLQEDDSPLTWQSASKLAGELVGIGVGSVALSATICLASAFILKHSDIAMRQYPTYETSVILLSAYASYVAGESFHLSGLLSVFFSGVFIRHYHMYNISKASAATFTHLLSTLAFLSENFLYVYLGVSVLAFSDLFKWDWGFIGASFAVCLVARALNTFPLCALANLCRHRDQRIPIKYMVVIWFSGLRGSIAFALVLNVRTLGGSDHAGIMRASTLFTVLFTTILFGAGTGPLLRLLQLRQHTHHSDEKASLTGTPDALSSGSQGGLEYGSVRELWVALDERHLKPLFGGKPRAMPMASSRRDDDGTAAAAFC
ncbi:hypothetical protein Gpo141_00007666 [Globisporangium polare]